MGPFAFEDCRWISRRAIGGNCIRGGFKQSWWMKLYCCPGVDSNIVIIRFQVSTYCRKVENGRNVIQSVGVGKAGTSSIGGVIEGGLL